MHLDIVVVDFDPLLVITIIQSPECAIWQHY